MPEQPDRVSGLDALPKQPDRVSGLDALPKQPDRVSRMDALPMSEWINIDKLGTKGIEPDLMPPHREPQSFDDAVNVRAVGPDLGNAGGYLAVQNGDFPP